MVTTELARAAAQARGDDRTATLLLIETWKLRSTVVFNIGGLGQDAVTAISQGNQPVILVFVVVASAFVVIANLIVDVVYAVLDPRVRIA